MAMEAARPRRGATAGWAEVERRFAAGVGVLNPEMARSGDVGRQTTRADARQAGAEAAAVAGVVRATVAPLAPRVAARTAPAVSVIKEHPPAARTPVGAPAAGAVFAAVARATGRQSQVAVRAKVAHVGRGPAPAVRVRAALSGRAHREAGVARPLPPPVAARGAVATGPGAAPDDPGPLVRVAAIVGPATVLRSPPPPLGWACRGGVVVGAPDADGARANARVREAVAEGVASTSRVRLLGVASIGPLATGAAGAAQVARAATRGVVGGAVVTGPVSARAHGLGAAKEAAGSMVDAARVLEVAA